MVQVQRRQSPERKLNLRNTYRTNINADSMINIDKNVATANHPASPLNLPIVVNVRTP